MSWNNPSQDEAQEAYDDARSRYNAAAEDYCQSSAAYETYSDELRQAQTKIDGVQSDKVNIEKRIEGIDSILNMLSENGEVNETIGEVTKIAAMAEEKMRYAINCTGVGSPGLGSAFRGLRVMEESHSASAYAAYKKERDRLVQSVAELNSMIANLEQSTQELTAKMNSAFNSMTDSRKAMYTNAYEMDHYKQYT